MVRDSRSWWPELLNRDGERENDGCRFLERESELNEREGELYVDDFGQ